LQTRKAGEKTEKTPQDPKAPKRALCAYMLFNQDWRERIKDENPEASFGLSLSLLLVSPTWAEGFGLGAGEVGKLLGTKWKEFDEEEKKVGLNIFSRYLLFLHD